MAKYRLIDNIEGIIYENDKYFKFLELKKRVKYYYDIRNTRKVEIKKVKGVWYLDYKK